jgi:GNAT superfamily N-acetyltransferase
MKFEEVIATDKDTEMLVTIRLEAMKESLEAVGRYDPKRARKRFLDNFIAAETMKIVLTGEVVGFYVVKLNTDHMLLDHFYIKPAHQGNGIGSAVLSRIKKQAQLRQFPLRLGALKNSRSNDFYKKNGFTQTHQEAWDNYFEFLQE